jgi:hypothetical protein
MRSNPTQAGGVRTPLSSSLILGGMLRRLLLKRTQCSVPSWPFQYCVQPHSDQLIARFDMVNARMGNLRLIFSLSVCYSLEVTAIGVVPDN